MRAFEEFTAFESVPVTYGTTTAPRDLERENAELRERIRWLERGDVLHVLTDQEYIDRGRREREMQASIDALDRDNAELRELVKRMHGYYVSGTLTPCDFCGRYDCEGDAPTTCEVDKYYPSGDELVRAEIERLARELGIEVGE